MELKDFIATSLKEIVAGVKTAQDEIREQGGYVNPATSIYQRPETFIGVTDSNLHVYRIDFDVAVTAASGKKTGASLGVQVASLIDAKLGGQSDAQRQTISRIRFSVPIALPVDQTSVEKKKAGDAQRKQQQDQAIHASRSRGSFVNR